MKAIVLEPSEQRRHLIRAVLAEQGHRVTVVCTVSELIAARRREGHHLVFVAADVVRREGLPLSQKLRRPGEKGGCFLLALEGEEGQDPRDLLTAGADDVLPASLDSAAIAMRTAIAAHHLRRALRRDRWFETLISLGSTVYAVTDEEGTILYASPNVSGFSEVRAEDLVGRRVSDLVIPEDSRLASRLFEEVASFPGEAAQTQLRWRRSDGAHQVVEASLRNCLEDPLIGGMILTTTDVTKQLEVESALATSEIRYRTLVETAREGIAIFDPDENLTFVNPAFAALLGFAREELQGRNLRDLTEPADFEKLRDQTVQRRSGMASRYETRLFSKRGDARIVSVSAAPLTNETGEFQGTLGLVTDITDRRREAERLRRSEERYRLIAENVSDVIWTRRLPEPLAPTERRDPIAAQNFSAGILENLKATYVSPSVTRMLGYSVEEALSLSIRETLTQRSYQSLVDYVAARFREGKEAWSDPVTLELEYRTKSGAARRGELTGGMLWDKEGRITGTLVVTRDVTQRKQVEEALLDSEHRLRRLIENMPDVVVLTDENAEIRYVNRVSAGYGPEQLIGQDGFSFLTEDSQEHCRRAFAEALETDQVQYVEVQGMSGLWWSCRLVPLREKSATTYVMIICTDVTEEKRANDALREEQDLLRQLIELHEHDRKVLAFELHDGFAQQLTGAMMSLEAAMRLALSAPDKAIAPLEQSLDLLRESIAESRRLVGGLRPPVLDQFGIVAAVEHLVGLNHCEDQLAIDFVSRGRARRMASPLENAVFRIVQETLTNIRRHSSSRKALVELRLEDDCVSVDVRDWGTGFDPSKVQEACFGLRGIRERARLLGGTAEVLSSPGEGTTVRVTLPMVAPPSDDGAGHESCTEVL